MPMPYSVKLLNGLVGIREEMFATAEDQRMELRSSRPAPAKREFPMFIPKACCRQWRIRPCPCRNFSLYSHFRSSCSHLCLYKNSLLCRNERPCCPCCPSG